MSIQSITEENEKKLILNGAGRSLQVDGSQAQFKDIAEIRDSHESLKTEHFRDERNKKAKRAAVPGHVVDRLVNVKNQLKATPSMLQINSPRLVPTVKKMQVKVYAKVNNQGSHIINGKEIRDMACGEESSLNTMTSPNASMKMLPTIHAYDERRGSTFQLQEMHNDQGTFKLLINNGNQPPQSSHFKPKPKITDSSITVNAAITRLELDGRNVKQVSRDRQFKPSIPSTGQDTILKVRNQPMKEKKFQLNDSPEDTENDDTSKAIQKIENFQGASTQLSMDPIDDLYKI